MSNSRVVLHVAPHPDDEILGASGTLLALQAQGWTVLNVAVSLGRPAQRVRRRAELEEACARVNFTLRVLDPDPGISGSDDLNAAAAATTKAVAQIIDETSAGLVVCPHPEDGHHGHEVVGASVLAAAARSRTQPPVWTWGLWADLRRPNLFVSVSSEMLESMTWALSAHVGELERNRYLELLEVRARYNAILGSERVFGWGSEAQPSEYAELLAEYRFDAGVLQRFDQPRLVDFADPLAELSSG